MNVKPCVVVDQSQSDVICNKHQVSNKDKHSFLMGRTSPDMKLEGWPSWSKAADLSCLTIRVICWCVHRASSNLASFTIFYFFFQFLQSVVICSEHPR